MERSSVPKPATRSASNSGTVRSRRAYFDCRYGQLHVRTAFPATGGFDEQVTLFCLHPAGSSSRVFSHFLPLAAASRSVYAADLPGCGESDPAGPSEIAAAAAAISDLATDLRLRQLDVLGLREGSEVAVELALSRADLVRRVVLLGGAPWARMTAVRQPCLVLRLAADTAQVPAQLTKSLPHMEVIDAPGRPDESFDAAAPALVKRVDGFLNR
jgi:pimeloyl-ACP methyl ester carboxylesterase